MDGGHIVFELIGETAPFPEVSVRRSGGTTGRSLRNPGRLGAGIPGIGRHPQTLFLTAESSFGMLRSSLTIEEH